MSVLHSAGFGWIPSGLIASAGKGVTSNANWGPFTEDRYIWGIQGDLYTSLAVPPSVGIGEYAQRIADMGVTVTNAQTGDTLIQKGVEHYDNAPTLNDHPHFFPRPFLLTKGQHLIMSAHAENGYGGSFGFNASVIVFFTYEP